VQRTKRAKIVKLIGRVANSRERLSLTADIFRLVHVASMNAKEGYAMLSI
jgi:hypothetical protein